ncbi:hypothetical protein D3C77_499510 [compost metagenome]
MIHADIAITRSGQPLYATVQHFQLQLGAGQLGGIDSPVGAVALGEVFMAENGQPVRL